MNKRRILLMGLFSLPFFGFIVLLNLLSQYADLISESSASDIRRSLALGLTEECRPEFEKFRSLLIENTDGASTKEELRRYTGIIYLLYEDIEKRSFSLATDRERLIDSIISERQVDRKFAEEVVDGLIKTASVYKLGSCVKYVQE